MMCHENVCWDWISFAYYVGPRAKKQHRAQRIYKTEHPSEETFEKSYDQTAKRNIHENKPAQVQGKTANK